MSHRILIVDDEAHILQVLSLKLRNAGYDVLTAVDGEEAFEYASKQQPDLVITDFQMPYMTGLEGEDLALGNIRDVLSKPFSPRAVVEKIERILQPTAGQINPQARSEVA
jgi:two-component system alkaline phosphatase synthesis response regulator PhoP